MYIMFTAREGGRKHFRINYLIKLMTLQVSVQTS